MFSAPKKSQSVGCDFFVQSRDENLGSTTKVACKLFVGSFAKQRPEGRAEHRCASVLILFFIVKPTFYKVELLLYNFKVRLYANIYIVLT